MESVWTLQDNFARDPFRDSSKGW